MPSVRADELARDHRADAAGRLAAHPDRAFADVVRGGGEAELRPGDREPERRALIEVRQELPRAGLRRAGVGGLLRKGLARLECPEQDLAVAEAAGTAAPSVPLGDDLRRAAVDGDDVDVEAPARERACRIGDPAAVAAPGGRRNDLLGRSSAAGGRRRRAARHRGSSCACRGPGERRRSCAGRETSRARCRSPPTVVINCLPT